jgi:type I restriction enzyme S subunit
MKQGWEIKKLGEVCEVIMGQSPNGESYNSSGDGIPLINGPVEFGKEHFSKTIKSKFTTSPTKYCKENDLILCVRGSTTGRINVAGFDACIGRGVAAIRYTKNQKWVNYFILLSRKKIYDLGTGATFPNVSAEMIKNLTLPIPPVPEQEKIVSILDKAFSAIEQAEQNAAKNLKNAKELFDSYLNSIFTNKGHDWEIKKLGEVCDFVRGPFGGSLKKSIFKSDGYVVYEQKHAIHDHFNQLRYFIDENKFSEMKRFELFPNDLIMSCSGVTLGRVAVVPDNIKKGIINQALLKLTPKKKIKVHFLKYWLRSSIFQKIIFEYSGGAAIPNVPSAKILKEIVIPYPRIEEQEHFIAKIEIILAETKQLEVIYQQKLTQLEDLKKSILQKAFNGNLKEIKYENF